MNYVLHCFIPGQTLEAVIKLKGRHDLPKTEVLKLVEMFNELNSSPVIRAGMTLKIPLPLDQQAESEGGLID